MPAATNSDDITIDCSCTVTNNLGDLTLNGSLTIASGTTLDGGAFKLDIGSNGNNSATLTNSGTLQNVSDLKAKGDGLVGTGPFIVNSGTINVTKISNVGQNEGGGKLTNTSTGTITVTGGNLHVDGTIDNQETISVTGDVLFHGAVLEGGGTFLVSGTITLSDNNGNGASGGPATITSQQFGAPGGCGDSSMTPPTYDIAGCGPDSWDVVLACLMQLADGTDYDIGGEVASMRDKR